MKHCFMCNKEATEYREAEGFLLWLCEDDVEYFDRVMRRLQVYAAN